MAVFALGIPVQACAQEQAQNAASNQNAPNVPERSPATAQGVAVTFGIGGGVDLQLMRGYAREVNDYCPVTLGRVAGGGTEIYIQVEGHPRMSRGSPADAADAALALCRHD